MTTTDHTTSRRHRARYHALGLGLGALHTLSLILAAIAAAAVGLLSFHQAPDTTSENTRVVLAIAGALIAMGMTDKLTDLTLRPVALRLRALRIREARRTDPATWTTAQIETALNLADIAHLATAKPDAA